MNAAATTREEEKTLRDARKLLEATNDTLVEKNKNDDIQHFVAHVKRLAGDKEMKGQFISDEAWDETREFLVSLKSLLMSLYKSSNFRNVLWMMFRLMKEIWVDQTGTRSKLREAFVEGHEPKQTATTISSDIQSTMKNMTLDDLPEKERNEIKLHFKQLLYEINSHPESADAIPKFFNIWAILTDEILSTTERNPEISSVQDEAKDVIEGIVGQSIDQLIKKLRVSARVVNHDEGLKDYFRDCRRYFERGLDYPDLVDDEEYLDEGNEIIRRGREYAQKYNEEPSFNDALDEAIKLMQSIKNDKNLNELQFRANKFLDNFTTRNAKGKVEVNTDLISAMRAHIIPLLLTRIKNIPVPGFNIHDDQFEYLKVDDLCVTVSDILPDNIFIHTANDIQLAVQDFESAPAIANSWLKIRIEGIRLTVPDFHFAFKRRKLLTIRDEGRASLKIAGNGLSLLLKYKFNQNTKNILGDSEVTVNIDRFQITVNKAKHRALLKIGMGILKSKIKKNIETYMADQVRIMSKEIGETLSETIKNLPKNLPNFPKKILE